MTPIQVRDLMPERCDRDGADFLIRADRPYLYVKPVLLRDGRAKWAEGENPLVLQNERRVLSPRFIPDARCSVCAMPAVSAPALPRTSRCGMLVMVTLNRTGPGEPAALTPTRY